MHQTIFLDKLSLRLPHKTCFDEFSTSIIHGQRIAIIGDNGSGKSSLLKMTEENVKKLQIKYAFLDQFPACNKLSGGENFNYHYYQKIINDPTILFLDEPSNHLDSDNKKLLIDNLNAFVGTVIFISHDEELLEKCANIIWHIDDGSINIFNGSYRDYKLQSSVAREQKFAEINRLEKAQKKMTDQLSKIRQQAAKSSKRGKQQIKQKKWPTVKSATKLERNSGCKSKLASKLNMQKEVLDENRKQLVVIEKIKPKFAFETNDIKDEIVINITDGKVGYQDYIITQINFSIHAKDRIVIDGANGSGKSTFIRALINDEQVNKAGIWQIKSKNIGYLDQDYSLIKSELTVLQHIDALAKNMSDQQKRKFLNDYLFRKNEEVNLLGINLSGGERLRLCLAIISLKSPRILVLDEPTNNLDINSKEHLIQVVKQYPGALIVISHDEYFKSMININDHYVVNANKLNTL